MSGNVGYNEYQHLLLHTCYVHTLETIRVQMECSSKLCL